MSKIADLYPPSPRSVPPDFTTPSRGYRQRVVIVLASLILFVVLYLGLVIGSAYFSYFSFAQLGQGSSSRSYNPGPSRGRSTHQRDETIWWLVPGICSAVLCVFLIKGLFKRQKVDRTWLVEITEEEQPDLFAFIRKLCQETKAPFPHRVYLTPEVNAAVFYHSSFLSLFLPTPKNLLIGLGLVNQLNLSEFKAVLAHEFGHFSQTSMKLGSYVYTSNRIIADIVFGRDWLDDVVAWVSRSDIRIAIVAWVFMGILWGTRKVLQGLFNLINFANSALSRQMEFNADLVAVSVSGSDALVHGLARLDFANDALNQTWQDLTAAGDHQLFTRDIFYHQNHAAAYLRGLRKNPHLGEPPPLSDDPRQPTQVFQPSDSGIPLMWATHPTNFDREQNAKSHYLRVSLDERSPWLLFCDPEGVREGVSRRYYELVRKTKRFTLTDAAEVQAFIDNERAETTYHPRYHGLYDNRFLKLGTLDDLVAKVQSKPTDAGKLRRVQANLFNDEVKARLEKYVARQQEFDLLAGLVDGTLSVKGKTFSFRDKDYRPADAAGLLKTVDKELTEDNEWFGEVDKRVFLVHYAMALQLHQETAWELENRYRFHVGVQDILNQLAAQNQQVQATLNQISGQRQLDQGVFQGALEVFRQARVVLFQQLRVASKMEIPVLKNMAEGALLGDFLLEKRLIEGLTGEEKSLDGQWINLFLQQLGEMFDKARRIHFKSLGAILALQERIAERWLSLNSNE